MRIFKKSHYSVYIILVILIIGEWAFSQDSDSNQTNAIKVTDGVYLLDGFGCNIAVSIGHDGVLIIDTGSPGHAERIKPAITEISGEPIHIVFNTHFHFDHVGGNEVFANDGAIIIAHKNARKRMLREWRVPEILGTKWPIIPPYPEVSLSKMSFNDSITVHFNKDTIQAIYILDAHSDGDVIIYFRKANVIHTGDLYLSNGFPIIDIYHGGTINGYIAAVDKIISLCDCNTKIIPGHGPLSDRDELQAYRDMLAISRDRIDKLIKEGKTLEEVIAADPTSNLYKGGKSWLSPELFVYVVYHDLSR